MSFFDDASLVMIPSGYKDQKVYSVKPTDGTGDLTFSRASSATRVQSDGLIEKVRTNHILQSNTFNTTWSPTTLTLTSGATAPDGTATAWTAAVTAASGVVQQAVTLTGLRTFSIYAKQGTLRYLYMGVYGGTISYATFDLQTGTIAAGTNARIESVGNGWYRCTCHSADGTTGGIQILPTDTISSGSLTSGNILIYESQYETGDIATDYIATTTAAVSVGPVSGLPRLDYLGSTCPRLLLEPQRTNLINYSEQLNNAWWSISNGTISANAVTSPDGYTNADNLVENTASGTHGAGNLSGLTLTAVPYTFSVFVKKQNRNFFAISTYDGSTTLEGYFNVNTGAVATMPAGLTGAITNYGNGWYRCSVTRTMGANANNYFGFNASITDGGSTYLGTGVVACSLFGGSLELGAYPTSYIPTLGASVTRVTEACSKTGVSSLIGQTAGSVFVEAFVQTGQESQFFWLRNPTGFYTDFMAVIFNVSRQVEFSVVTGGTTQVFITSAAVSQGFHKVAIGYANNDFVLYIDGVQIGTDSSGTPPTCSDLFIDQFIDGGLRNVSKKQALLFKTRLTNAQLAELTA